MKYKFVITIAHGPFISGHFPIKERFLYAFVLYIHICIIVIDRICTALEGHAFKPGTECGSTNDVGISTSQFSEELLRIVTSFYSFYMLFTFGDV